MPTQTLELIHLDSLDDLRAASPQWDDLWLRSSTTNPCAQAELVAQWVGRFADESSFHALILASRGRWVAALPMIGIRIRGLLPAAGLPRNAWTRAGDLLIDPEIEAARIAEQLLAGLHQLPWGLAWFDEVPLDAPHWRSFVNELRRLGIRVSLRERFRVGIIPVTEPWEEYWRGVSKNLRYNLSRAARRLTKQGDMVLDTDSGRDAVLLESKLRQAFAIEDSGWKGQHGSSVLRRGMYDFLRAQAEYLSAQGKLRLFFLRLSDTPIASCYGAMAKGVFHYFKTGYDPSYAKFSPGQLLLYYLLQHLRISGDCHAVDTIGELTDATAQWRPTTYRVGQVVFPLRKLVGRAVTYVHQRWWPRIRCWLDHGVATAKATPARPARRQE